jgi:hypothetical protein
MRIGKAVLIFVTEDFSKSKQVKLDNPDLSKNDKVSVLKLNNIRRFTTGIYDYSLMQSVFTPIDLAHFPHTLKTTSTAQDWCGHTFMQMNLRGNSYRFIGNSYFEKEGDVDVRVPVAMLEDELLTRLRVNPKSIPEGVIELIPSAFYFRLHHESVVPKKARIRIETGESTSKLFVEYLHLDRTIIVDFESEFPHKIFGWTETKGSSVISKGRLLASIKSAYWEQNGNAFENMRDSLLLNL